MYITISGQSLAILFAVISVGYETMQAMLLRKFTLLFGGHTLIYWSSFFIENCWNSLAGQTHV